MTRLVLYTVYSAVLLTWLARSNANGLVLGPAIMGAGQRAISGGVRHK